VIIECPRCLTRFKLDETRLAAGSRPVLKCSRCQHVFSAPATPSAPAPPAAPAARPAPRRQKPEQESLSFSFDDEDDWQSGPVLAKEPADEVPFSLDDELAGTHSPQIPQAPPTTAAAPTPAPRSKPKAARRTVDDDLDEEDFTDEDEEETVAEPVGSISIRPVLIFLVLVVGAYAVLARALYADPDWARQLTGKIPLFGGGGQNRSLNVLLMGVEARYETSKEGSPVLLVRGEAQNQSSSSLQNVQVVTRLFDAAEHPIAEQLAFCGNSVRPELVRDLNIRQIAILKGLKPPQRFAVQAGEKCPFVTIFTELPATVSSFTAEVVAAQGHA
jgi:predicted Zn finger-like uncharacterized protein